MPKLCVDSAWPLANPPQADVTAFYIGGDTPHPWTDAEVAAIGTRYRVPIFVRSYPGDPVADGNWTVNWLAAHQVPKGTPVMLDLEMMVNAAYVTGYGAVVRAAGWLVLPYGSRSMVTQNPPLDGYWTANWTNVAHIDPEAVATQYGSIADYDLSWIADSVPLWDPTGPTVTVRNPTEEHASAMSVIYGPDHNYHMCVATPAGTVDHYFSPDPRVVMDGTAPVDHLGGKVKALCGQFWTVDNLFYVVVGHGMDDHLYRIVFDVKAGWGPWQLLNIPLLPPAAGTPGPPGPAGPAYDDRWIHTELAAIKAAITG